MWIWISDEFLVLTGVATRGLSSGHVLGFSCTIFASHLYCEGSRMDGLQARLSIISHMSSGLNWNILVFISQAISSWPGKFDVDEQ